MVEGFPDNSDTVLGTVDQGDLEEEWCAPDRHFWWEKGIKWVQYMVTGRTEEMLKHLSFKVSELVE